MTKLQGQQGCAVSRCRALTDRPPGPQAQPPSWGCLSVPPMAACFLISLGSTNSHMQSCALCDDTEVPPGVQMSPAGCLPSRNLWPSCSKKTDVGNYPRTTFRPIQCTLPEPDNRLHSLPHLLLISGILSEMPIFARHVATLVLWVSQLENRIDVKSGDVHEIQFFMLQVNSANKSLIGF